MVPLKDMLNSIGLDSVYGIYQQAVKKSNYETALVAFDSIIECSINGSSSVISYPVESGFMATEFKFQNPSTIEMKGIISESSILGLKGGLQVPLLSIGQKEARIERIKWFLDEFKNELTLLKIKTRTSIRENYTLVDYRISESRENYGALEVDMVFQEVLFPDDPENLANDFDSDTNNTGISQVVAQ